MRNRLALKAKASRGFTLIDLVIVVAILGVITAIVTPLIMSTLGASKERSYDAKTDRIQAAVDTYRSAPEGTWAGRSIPSSVGRRPTRAPSPTRQTR